MRKSGANELCARAAGMNNDMYDPGQGNHFFFEFRGAVSQKTQGVLSVSVIFRPCQEDQNQEENEPNRVGNYAPNLLPLNLHF